MDKRSEPRHRRTITAVAVAAVALGTWGVALARNSPEYARDQVLSAIHQQNAEKLYRWSDEGELRECSISQKSLMNAMYALKRAESGSLKWSYLGSRYPDRSLWRGTGKHGEYVNLYLRRTPRGKWRVATSELVYSGFFSQARGSKATRLYRDWAVSNQVAGFYDVERRLTKIEDL